MKVYYSYLADDGMQCFETKDISNDLYSTFISESKQGLDLFRQYVLNSKPSIKNLIIYKTQQDFNLAQEL